MLAGLCDICKRCFNQICAPTCLFSNTNIRITVPHPGDTHTDREFDKVVGVLTKSINHWHSLHTNISAAQSNIQELCVGIIIAMIFKSQLVSNIGISEDGGYVEAEFLIFILEESGYCCHKG